MLYSVAATRSKFISETNKKYSGERLKESDLALRWFRYSKRLSRKLRTNSGDRVVVIEPGVPNRDSGPDFQNAMLLIRGVALKGDVEIHLHARSWYDHNHHSDRTYTNVILHVVAFKSDNDITIGEDDKEIPIVCLPLSTDWDARINKKPKWPWENGCYHEMSELNPGEIYLLLVRLGRERLNQKRKKFKLQLESGNSYGELFYRGFARALGYSKNTSQFSRFSSFLPLSEIRKITKERASNADVGIKLESLLFGLSGLLETGVPDSRMRLLSKNWKKIKREHSLEQMQSGEWKFFRLRPQNFPTRRMAGLSEFLKRYDLDRFIHLTAYAVKKFRSVEKFISALETSLKVDGDEYWSRASKFGSKMSRSSAIIGKSKARSIALNAVLPLLGVLAEEEQDRLLAAKVDRILFLYPPEEDNSVLKQVRRFALPCSPEHMMFSSSAIVQQGMLQLYERWCSKNEVSNCPLSISSRIQLNG
ncbi:MAG: DUF2851 family protein [Candidatus Marinimicrobia bacterium]|nr:DUF2851 family protein [Candidatus Neomarinimicrobiota bacterium]